MAHFPQVEAVSKLKESYHALQKHVDPKGLAAASTIAFISPLFIPAIQLKLTHCLHEMEAAQSDPIGLLGLGLAAAGIFLSSIALESATLRKKRFSNSPIASTLNIAVKPPEISATSAHTLNFLLNYSPVQFANAILFHSEKLSTENAIAIALTLGGWNIFWNSLILSNLAEPVTKEIRKGMEKVFQIAKRKP